jgi:hypothetical protein
VRQNGGHFPQGRFLSKKLVHQVGKTGLVLVPQNNIRLAQGFGIGLGKTTQNADDSIGRNSAGATHHLTAFSTAFFRNGTGVYHRHVTRRTEGDELSTFFGKKVS